MNSTIKQERRLPSIEEQNGIADYFARTVIDDATGLRDGDTCLDAPRARYYLSKLAPEPTNRADPSHDRNGNNALGFEFEVEDGAELAIQAQCSVYYRILPTYEQQVQRYELGQDEKEDGKRVVAFPTALVYERFNIGPVTVKTVVSTEVQNLGADLFQGLFEEASRSATSHKRAFRRIKNVPRDKLIDKDTFESFLATDTSEKARPSWKAHIAIISRRTRERRLRVNVLFVNETKQPMRDHAKAKSEPVTDDDIDPFLFRCELRVQPVRGNILPIDLYLGPDAYRYDGRLPAFGMNCGVLETIDQTGAILSLRSVAAPIHSTSRIFPTYDASTKYENLASDPIPVLEHFLGAMEDYAKAAHWSQAHLTVEQQRHLTADKRKAELETRRFREGIRWLERDPNLIDAFKLANLTMTRLNDNSDNKDNTAWHPFQLVAIVCELPTLATREHALSDFVPGLWGDDANGDPTEAVSIVYFPTGGGKTETYLGMIACYLFYDRLRGKERGVTAICRFPLKVLTTNQCQRMTDFIVAADSIREEKAIGRQPFELGLFIGGDETPNYLSRSERSQREQLDDFKVIERCPYCRKTGVTVERGEPLRLNHVCRSCGQRIPIIITDGEIYRYMPAVVIGTLDKFAAVGLSSKFGALLGDVDSECSLHGFARGGICVERSACRGQTQGTIAPLTSPLYDASPGLEVIDELHLLNEELGAFDGHYETAIAEYQKSLSALTRADKRGVRMKIVATTATIKGEDRQVEHLFGLRSVVMPSLGPSLKKSFYWERDDKRPLRRFVGIQPSQGMTAEFTVIRVLTALHAAIQDMIKTGPTFSPAFSALTPDQFKNVCDMYRRSLTYMTSLIDFGKLQRSMKTQIDADLIARGYSPINLATLHAETSREGIGRVRAIVEDLQSADGEKDAIIGTSSVSHGIDIDQLNLMVFNGMPKSMAEYIQASSRVGRRALGVVFILYNPVRERDRSHFRLHGKFHEYLDRHVEPVAINRWSKFAAEKTFPGLFMGYLLEVLNRYWWDAGNGGRDLHALANTQAALRQAVHIPEFQISAIEVAMRRIYLCDRPEADSGLDAEIRRLTNAAVSSLRIASPAIGHLGGKFDYKGTSDFLGLRYKPMTSLRDVDEGILFFPIGGKKS